MVYECVRQDAEASLQGRIYGDSLTSTASPLHLVYNRHKKGEHGSPFCRARAPTWM